MSTIYDDCHLYPDTHTEADHMNTETRDDSARAYRDGRAMNAAETAIAAAVQASIGPAATIRTVRVGDTRVMAVFDTPAARDRVAVVDRAAGRPSIDAIADTLTMRVIARIIA